VRKPAETLSGDPDLELPEFDSPPGEPLTLLESWLRGADARGVREPRALALATADAAGRPSNRIVLLKQASPSIVFAFSANSRKGRDLEANPRAAGTLYWRETLQQVVIEGPVERMSATESDGLFAERPAGAGPPPLPPIRARSWTTRSGCGRKPTRWLRAMALCDAPKTGAATGSTPT
jgi:dihydrophenazinedicarboxylate synthase